MTNCPYVFKRFYPIDYNQMPLPRLYGIGKENWVAGQSYDWDCLHRKDPHYVFQYTLSGEGELIIDGIRRRLPPGYAFLIEVPGPYRYRLPEHSSHWEFMFTSLSLDFVFLWKRIIQLTGHIFKLEETSEVLLYWKFLYGITMADQMRDSYQRSTYSYNFMMKLLRWAEQNAAASDHTLPNPVALCLEFIKNSYHLDIGIEDMARAAQISRCHLTRLFRHSLNNTPQHYLIEARLKSAARMLSHTSLPIEQVALQNGFSNGNYFAKAFRKWTGIKPTDYRSNPSILNLENNIMPAMERSPLFDQKRNF